MLRAGISFAKKIIRDNKVFFLKLFIIGFILDMLPLFLNNTINSDIVTVLLVINTIVHIIFFFIIITMNINFYDDNKAKISELFKIDIILYIKILMAGILILIITILPNILLFIPILGWFLWVILMVALSIRLCFVVYLIIDDELGPLEAILENMSIVSGYAGKLFGIFILSALASVGILLIKDGIKEVLIIDHISTIYSSLERILNSRFYFPNSEVISIGDQLLIKGIDSVFALLTYIIGTLIMGHIYKTIKGSLLNR